LLPYILFEKYIYILALEMDSPGNLHCANCIDTLLLLRRRCCWRPPLSIDISFRRGAQQQTRLTPLLR